VLIGRFLEFAIPTERPLESLEFYRQLGFKVATDTGADVSSQVVVSDGRLSIALCDRRTNQPTLVFVCPGFSSRIDQLERAGLIVDAAVIGEHTFNRLDGHIHNGPHLRLLEARTHSPVRQQPSLLGWFEDISLVTHRRDMSVLEALGFVALPSQGVFGDGLTFTSDAITLSVYNAIDSSSIWLNFECDDLAGLRDALARLGVDEDVDLAGDLDRRHHLIVKAPEGTFLLAKKADYTTRE
jgi:hypothetical protein